MQEAPAPANPLAGSRPNFIFFVADDLSWSDLRVYGNASSKTPAIDALASRGMRFERAYLTTASCSPSRASMLTGLYPHNTGAQHLGQSLPFDAVLFPGLLRDAGYFTATAGKWHIGHHARHNFEQVLEKHEPRWHADREWLQVLRERPRDKPFFFWFASADPHRPFDLDATDKPVKPNRVQVPADYPNTPAVRRELAAYYGELSRLDGHIAAVVGELEAQGVLEDTAVIFLADNGRPFPRAKATLYEAGIKTPLILSWPARIDAGAVNPQLVSTVDLAPTVLALAGVKVPRQFQGVSLLPTLMDVAEPVRDYAFSEQNWHGANIHERSVRTADYAYIYSQKREISRCESRTSAAYKEILARHERGELPGAVAESCFGEYAGSEALYALQRDPHSLENLVARPELSGLLEAMRATLADWQERTDDQPWERFQPPKCALEADQPGCPSH